MRQTILSKYVACHRRLSISIYINFKSNFSPNIKIYFNRLKVRAHVENMLFHVIGCLKKVNVQ